MLLRCNLENIKYYLNINFHFDIDALSLYEKYYSTMKFLGNVHNDMKSIKFINYTKLNL